MLIARWIALIILVVRGASCFVSGESRQIFFAVNFSTVRVEHHSHSSSMHVNLNSDESYVANKQHLQSLKEAAVTGSFQNLDSLDVAIELWMSPETTGIIEADKLRESGTLLWEDVVIGPGDTLELDQRTSSGLITADGMGALWGEVKSDSLFGLYFLGKSVNQSSEVASFTVENAKLYLVLNVN